MGRLAYFLREMVDAPYPAWQDRTDRESEITSSKFYRADIDGLRALAILPVVWFHSGLPGMSGGFVGVDIFFVISGYLITHIVRSDLAAGSFSFGYFFRRRFRRIAPALVIVLCSTLAAGYLLLVPDELVRLARSAIAALAMVPNLYFWLDGGGDYFALAKRAPPPLLHTWSLGIEEQFYLLFPAFMLLATRHRIMQPAIIAVVLTSFALCVIGSINAPQSTFFLLPARAWELGLGAMLAVKPVSIPTRWRAVASVGGFAMIASSIVLLAGQGVSPLWAVAVPATGTTILIACGTGAPVNRALAWSPLAEIGRISYSLYLWHWPIFAFLQRWCVDEKLPVAWLMVGIGISLVLAWSTYRWVEQPARRSAVRFGAVAAIVAGGAVVVLVGAGLILARGGLPERFTLRGRAMLAVANDHAPLALSCLNNNLADVERTCYVGEGAATAMVWGDSHAASDSAGIAAALGQPTVVIGNGGCPPTLDPRTGVTGGCIARNREILAWLDQRPRITTIVFAALWLTYERSDRDRFWRGMDTTIAALGKRRVIVLVGVPYPGVNMPTDSAIREQWGRAPFHLSCPLAGSSVHGAIVVDVSAAFCAYPEPWRLFVDRNHPSMTANQQIIAPELLHALANQKQQFH